MARNTKTVAIEADNRDGGKKYALTEMPALKAERWAFRVLSAAAKGGADIPIEAASLGMAAISIVGLQALIRCAPEDAVPLLDEMMDCVQFMPQTGVARPLIESDIEEVTTLLRLRSEVVELHTGFSLAAGLSTLGKVATKERSTSPKQSTSRRRSRPS